MFLRFVVFAVILGAIILGVRSILKDWRGRFREMDEQARERDLRERQRPDVIDLKRNEDGIFRPGDDDKDQS